MQIYSQIFLGIITFLLGSIIASFLNVVAQSVPIGKNWWSRRSRCPHCQTLLTPKELIPIFSFIIQWGRCKSCYTKISSTYFATEVTGGLLFLTPLFLLEAPYTGIIQAWLFFSLLLTVTLTDIYYQLIPNKILISFAIGLFLIGGNVYVALVGFFFFYLLLLLGKCLFKKEIIGGGDIKLYLLIGWVLSLQELFLSIFLSSGLALIYILMTGKNKPIPFAPFIALGAIIAYLTGLY